MSSPDLTSGDVMDKVAALMNDTAKQNYTYTAQLPYLQMAMQDLRKLLELNNSPVTEETSAIIEVDAGVEAIGFSTTPALPVDLIEIQQLWESPRDQDSWIPMSRKDYLPHYLENIEVSQWLFWTWISNQIRLLPSIADNDLKIDYIRGLFIDVEDENSELAVINADSYLQFRTAALCAEFIGENPVRALSLNMQAKESFDVMIGIDNKGKQGLATRRRPFRSSWKQRSTF